MFDGRNALDVEECEVPMACWRTMIDRNEDLCRGCDKDSWGVGEENCHVCWEMARVLGRTINWYIVAIHFSCHTQCQKL